MRRGTTPIHTFEVDIDLNHIVALYVTYKQGKKIILEKSLEDEDSIVLNPEEKTISVKLSQEDTLKFKDKNWTYLYPNLNSSDTMVKVQIRLKYVNGVALASNIMLLDVTEILKEGEI